MGIIFRITCDNGYLISESKGFVKLNVLLHKQIISQPKYVCFNLLIVVRWLCLK